MSTIITPPGAPTVIQREKPASVVLRTDRPQVVVTGDAAPVVPVCEPHPVVVGNPVSKTVEVVAKGPKGDPGVPGPPGPPGADGVVPINAAKDGDIPEYDETLGGYVARRDPRKLLIDGGNF